MADELPPPYPGAEKATTNQPGGPAVPGYPPQTSGQAYPAPPQAAYPPQPMAGYPPQPMAGYPPQPTAGYPQQAGQPPPQKGYAPAPTGYPPPGHIQQQPMGYTSTHNTNTTVVLTQPATVTTAVIPYMNDYMGLSIFSCLCCCWCIGLFAIIKSSEARSNYAAGNYTQALASATTARNLSYAAIFCGIGVVILIIIVTSV